MSSSVSPGSKKIRVLFQLNELTYSGTTRAILSFCRYLDRSQFEVHLFYKREPRGFKYFRHRLESFFSKKAKDRFVERYVSNEVRKQAFVDSIGLDKVSFGGWSEFVKTVSEVSPDIIHFSRGEQEDWFTGQVQNLPTSIVIVETSIFGKSSIPSYVQRINKFFNITDWLRSQNSWLLEKGRCLYLPILPPSHPRNVRERYGISDSELVVGRISRPGLDNAEEVFQIFKKIKTPCRLLVLGGAGVLENEAKKDNRIICLPPTTDEDAMSNFYNTLDVLLHYRREGETFGMSIADSMIHGKPVVSHRRFKDNAQAELLNIAGSSPCGFVVGEDDFDDHAVKIDLLLRETDLRLQMGELAKARALKLFEAKAVTLKLQE